MVGNGTYNQPLGTWSDDSSMTLATVESIGRLGKIDTDDIMKNFLDWLNNATFTPYNKVFDVGARTLKSIAKYARGVPIDDCGGKSYFDNGNGALMRILPVAIAVKEDVANRLTEVEAVAKLTHNHLISHIACFIYTIIVTNLINKMDKEKAVEEAINTIGKLYRNSETWQEYCSLSKIGKLERNKIKSSGYVVDTLEAAIWCLLNTNSYKDCVLLAVNLGKDTDTIAAVAGGLAGIIYGCGDRCGIPNEWISQITRKEWIKGLCDKFENKLLK